MKYAYTAVALALAAMAPVTDAQLSNVPSCALDCFVSALSSDGCSSVSDFKCHCSKPGLIGTIQPCVEKACDSSDQAAVISVVEQTCSSVGEPLSISTPAPTSATSTAASTSSTPSSTPASSMPSSTPASSMPSSSTPSETSTSASSSSSSSSSSSASSPTAPATTSAPSSVASQTASTAGSSTATSSVQPFTGGATHVGGAIGGAAMAVVVAALNL